MQLHSYCATTYTYFRVLCRTLPCELRSTINWPTFPYMAPDKIMEVQGCHIVPYRGWSAQCGAEGNSSGPVPHRVHPGLGGRPTTVTLSGQLTAGAAVNSAVCVAARLPAVWEASCVTDGGVTAAPGFGLHRLHGALCQQCLSARAGWRNTGSASCGQDWGWRLSRPLTDIALPVNI